MTIRTKIVAITTTLVLAVTPAIAHADTIDNVTTSDTKGVEGGTTYHVEPTSSGRVGSSALSSDPSPEMESHGIPATQSLVNQFLCHVIFAPFKPLWNLEDHRPAVGSSDTFFSRCNP